MSCYLQDHHNREGECLIGITPHGQTDAEAVEELQEELLQHDYPTEEQVSTTDRVAALTEAVKGVGLPLDRRTYGRSAGRRAGRGGRLYG